MIKFQATERRALLIDDDEDARFFARAALEGCGFIVREAEGAERGLAAFGEMKPHIVMLDYQMPGMDGLECCRRIRARWSGPIMMLSGREDPQLPALAFEAGADRFVRKPANWSHLADLALQLADRSG